VAMENVFLLRQIQLFISPQNRPKKINSIQK
jgi:hypothetical protein